MESDVITVKPVASLALEVEFADGTVGQVRFEPSHLTGVFAALKDPMARKALFQSGCRVMVRYRSVMVFSGQQPLQ